MLPLLVLPIATCVDSNRPPPTSPRAVVGPLCQLGCTETDPYPDSAGVFLGSGVTPDVCTDGTDSDLDGLEDFCEKNLIAAFAPQLAYAHADQVGREPHWVARPLSEDEVRLGYLLSYYVDNGIDDPACVTYWGYLLCRGHAGDSEDLYLDVQYHWASQHWVLITAYYSAHGNYNTYGPGPSGYPALTYPAHPGTYPRTYVAFSKHANYASDGECDAGMGGFDDCLSDSYARVESPANANLGSRTHQRLNCMYSSNPLYSGNGVQECYWTGSRFSGWQGFQPDASPYSPKLDYFGF